jgi:hypothetical protein
MSRSIALLFGVHAHQPVGNFASVLDDAYLRCYQPFLSMMHRFPQFLFSIHISGWLYDYLLRRYPDDIPLLKEIVARGQVELFGAGYTEPVLASIPVRDRIGQINFMADRLEQTLGQRPKGAWLTERVWDSTVVPALVDCGIEYVIVDDYHFLCAGKENSELTGFFSTEEDGRRLDVFPISEALRYRLPFAPAAEVVSYLESLAAEDGVPAAVYFDDIEKFGIWPETYDWVYKRGWLNDFIEGVLASSIIKPMRYCDYHAQERTRGVVYLPTTSYIEMNEWTLPALAANRFDNLIQDARRAGHYESIKSFLRGGIWRNFFTRYPESNWMHKRMLLLSARFSALPPLLKTKAMRESLYEAQANDAYWHGLFGGLYLPHLRRAIYNALVRLEGLLDIVSPRYGVQVADLDFDGHDEIFLHNGVLQAIIRTDGLADICELDAYRLNHNFGDTLTRQVEHYHHKINLSPGLSQSKSGVANPHEQINFKHDVSPDDVRVDALRRSLFIDRLIVKNQAEVLRYLGPEGIDVSQPVFTCQQAGISMSKQFSLEDNRILVQYTFLGPTQGQLEVELNLAMPSCDGPAGSFRNDDGVLGGFGQPLELARCRNLILHDEVLGGKLILSTSQDAKIFSEPCFSVSQSEAGFEKIMQAVTIRLAWSLDVLSQPLVVSLTVVP